MLNQVKQNKSFSLAEMLEAGLKLEVVVFWKVVFL